MQSWIHYAEYSVLSSKMYLSTKQIIFETKPPEDAIDDFHVIILLST